ncbi:hypothetical protein FJQ54_13900 [Sandaracinobacter neustonicus]|uniref:Uncharacterized protein n=1 Tax=Sandaracinobacter neustonicus TaxID=1715348 RepID=A0A501XG99_9SPHN|nr:hypothetical protein [Sandaracinobacter neustonicus]TPE59566.1 hypothetical protein FJQ54_13900 [Sandaracinobacter neustonicus]
MGQDSNAIAVWRGGRHPVRLHLDSMAFELSGGLKLRIPRAEVGLPRLQDGRLLLTISGEPLEIELAEAARWDAALRKPPPSLAQKLGISADKPGCLIGDTDDPALLAALDGASAPDTEAALLIALVASVADLAPACARARGRPIWIVTGKGHYATVRESELRTELRALGFADSKSCAVSERLTATRYAERKG